MCSFVKPHEGETTLSEMYCFFAIKSLTSPVKELHHSEYRTKVKFLRTDIFGRIMNRDRYLFFCYECFTLTKLRQLILIG